MKRQKEEDITIINIYAPNIVAPQYITQMLTTIRGEIDSDIVTVGNKYCKLSYLVKFVYPEYLQKH